MVVGFLKERFLARVVFNVIGLHTFLSEDRKTHLLVRTVCSNFEAALFLTSEAEAAKNIIAFDKWYGQYLEVNLSFVEEIRVQALLLLRMLLPLPLPCTCWKQKQVSRSS